MRTLLLAATAFAALLVTAPIAAADPPAAPAAASPAAPAAGLTLSDFGSAKELARFVHRGIADDHFTLLPGGGGVRVDFVPFVAGGQPWPAVLLRPDKGLPTDWSAYDALAADVRNVGTAPITLNYQIDDAAGNKKIAPYTLAPGESRTLRLPLTELDPVDPTQVREMQFFTTRPPAELVIEVRRLRLETDDAVHRALLAKQVRDADALFARLRKETHDPAALAYLRAQQKRGQILAGQLLSAPDRAEQNRVRAELAALTPPLTEKVRRIADESKLRHDFARIAPQSPYAVGWATSMKKVFPVDRPFEATVARTGRLEVAGNEKESLQLLVLAGTNGLKDVHVSVGVLTRTDGKATLPASAVSVAPVGFVRTKRPTYKVDYVGWYPDPILGFLDRVRVKPGEMQPFWIRISAPAGTPAGVYTGTVTVHPADAPPVKLALNVAVWGFDLSKETHLRTAVSLSEFMLRKVYGQGMPETLRQKYCTFLLENRLNPDNIYRTDPPMVADLELWNRQGMNAFNLTYVPRPAGLKPGDPYPAALKAQILARLDGIIPQLKTDGLYPRAYVYGFDEVNADSFSALRDMFGAIHAKYPDLLLMTTGRDATYGEKSGLSQDIVSGWIPLTPQYDPVQAEKARKKGTQVWWYTCIVPQAPYANWLIEYDAIEARSLMGVQTAKYRPDGYLYYCLNRWPLSDKPITSGPYTDWPPASLGRENGDGSVLCAGPGGPIATIRLENIRDGIEDNEYFYLLRQEIEKLKRIPGPQAAAALRQAEIADTVGPDVVADLTHFSKSPEVLYAKRRQVAEAILAARRVTGK